MPIRISELTDAGALAGTEYVELARLSPTVKITAATISAAATDNSLNDSGSGFVAAGFAVGQSVRVQGFTGNVANNIQSGRITALTTGKLTIGGIDGDALVDDAAGESVTVTKWETRRGLLPAVAASSDTVTVLTSSAGVVTVNCALGDYFTLALTENVTSFVFTNPPGAGKGFSKWIEITQHASAAKTVALSQFKWAGGIGTTAVSSALSAVDVLALTSVNNGTTVRAVLSKAYS